MNFFLAEVLVTIAVIVLVDGSPVEYYTTKYDRLDVEEVLSNRRMVKYYANCLLSRGPCTPQGLELKKILPEALETNCLRCTEKQKDVTYQTIKRLRKEYPKTWALLQVKWDPKNIYVKRFEESFNKKPSPSVPENEVIIENRFGDSDDDSSKPSTTVRIQTSKPKLTTAKSSIEQPTKKPTRIPSINSIASASENKPSSVPQGVQNTQYPNVNVTNQVGIGTQEEVGNKKQIPSSMNTVKTPSTFKSTTASTISISHSSTASLTQSYSPVNSPKVIFDIPESSMNHSQTQKILTQNSGTTKTTTEGKTLVRVTEKRPAPTRQSDPISQLVFSFLNANRPRTSVEPTTSTTSKPESPNLQIRLPKISGLIRKVGVRNRPKVEANSTVQINVRRPLIQVRLPGLTVRNQIEGFNPVGNIVRGLANAGDRLIETGTSIADNVLTSVRGLFNPTARRDRSLRRN